MSYTRSKRKLAKRGNATLKSPKRGSRSLSRKAERQEFERQLNDTRIIESSGNVFQDIGFPPEQARNLLWRSELMAKAEELIRSRGLTQVQAAKLFGVTQPRISDLMKGKFELFSLQGLINMLTRAGMAVHLVVEQNAA